MMAERDTGVDLREIERIQNRKLNHLAFVIWSLAMVVLGMVLEKILGE